MTGNPDCLRSWPQDLDGDGTYTFTTSALPAGDYEVKVAIGESWDENYGRAASRNGPNILFTVPASCREMFFSYDAVSHPLTVTAEARRAVISGGRTRTAAADTVA